MEHHVAFGTTFPTFHPNNVLHGKTGMVLSVDQGKGPYMLSDA